MKILKLIITGLIAGAALFFMPFFILRIAIAVFLIASLLKLFGWRRFGSNKFGNAGFAYADKIRNMSEEEFNSFKQNNRNNCGRTKNNQTN